jgi:hypothetical protein
VKEEKQQFKGSKLRSNEEEKQVRPIEEEEEK